MIVNLLELICHVSLACPDDERDLRFGVAGSLVSFNL